MEQVDIIDSDDQVIGQAARSDCHTNASLTHRAVHFTLVNPGARRIMISRRALTKKHDGGKFCFLGEHVLAGESYEDAVRRGIAEEFQAEAATLQAAGEHIFSGDTFTERVKMFLVTARDLSNLQPDPNEIAELQWLTAEELGHLEVSAMTRYWTQSINWAQAFAYRYS